MEAEEARSPIGGWEKVRDEYAAPVLLHADPDFDLARNEGRVLSLEQTVSYALGETHGEP